MEILLGLATSGIAEVTKILAKKFGDKISKRIVHGTVFMFVLIFTYSISEGLVSREALKNYVEIFAIAYTNYRLIIKPTKKVISNL